MLHTVPQLVHVATAAVVAAFADDVLTLLLLIHSSSCYHQFLSSSLLLLVLFAIEFFSIRVSANAAAPQQGVEQEDGRTTERGQHVDAGGRAIGDEHQRHWYGGVSSQLSRVIGCRAAR
mgnify:CR=1 FL=1